MEVRGHGGDQGRGEPRATDVPVSGRCRYAEAPAGWPLMVGESGVVNYNTVPVLLHVTLLEKNLCVGGGVWPICTPH